MIAPGVALAYLAWRFYAGAQAIAGKHASPARIDLLPAQFEEDPRFARACDELLAIGFTPIGDFEVRANIGPNTRQRTVLRALLAPDRSAYAVVYELASLTVLPNARAGARKIWAEMVSRRSENESLTTSNGEPPLALLDPNPERPVRRFPGAGLAQLWAEHRAAMGASLQELSAEEFAPRFTLAWTRTFEFQESRGLYQRRGEVFVATGKLALRSVLDFHLKLRHRQGPAYALLVFCAVAAGAAAVGFAQRRLESYAVPMAAAIAGAVFAVLFRHFEVPGALFVAAMSLVLGRDDLYATLAFLAVLIQGAVLLQRRRAAAAAARLAG